jgi:hypothetical protein
MSAFPKNHCDRNTKREWKTIYIIGGFTSVIVLAAILCDIIVGSILGSDLSTLPKTAVDRFAQIQNNWWVGLYNLDLLNTIIQIILIPTYFALFAAHRNGKSAYAFLALIIFLVGTTVFITNNTALPMLELSHKYAAAATESEKTLLVSAGETMLARGTHGSPGTFIGFVLPTIAGIIMSLAMLTGKIFNKATSYIGISGNVLLLVYLVLVTFTPGTEKTAMLFSMPGGILMMVWMIMFTIKLFQLGHSKNE